MEDTKHNRTYADLPEDVLLFLSDVDAVDQAQAFLKKYGGREEDAALLLGTGEQIVLGVKLLADLPKIFINLLGIEESKASVAAAEYATVRLLPIAGVIGDVSGQIVKWGGKLGELSQNQGAILPQVTAEQFVAHVMEELKITEAEPDPVSQHRLLLLLSSYVKGIRDVAETKDALMRGEKIGGMELPEEIADELLSYVNDKMKFLRIADAKKEEPSNESAKPAIQAPPRPRVLRDIKQPVLPAQKPVEPKPVVVPPPPVLAKLPTVTPAPIIKKPEPPKEEVFGKGEEREAKEIATKQAIVTSFPKETVRADQMAQMILQKINLPFTDQLQKRFESLVEARLHGVRDVNQTRQHLAKPVLQGGLGMAGEMLVKVSDILEEEVGRILKPHTEKIVQEKQQSLQGQMQKREQKKEVDTRESQLLSKRYASITGKAPTESVEPMHATGVRVTANRSVAEHLDRQEEKIDKAKVRQAIEAAKPPASVPAVSHSTPTILPTGDRPKVQDVHFAKHLEGPVEELKRMTLVDFRRLASSANASVQRVVDKIELLREQGPDRMVAGVQAWKQSPLYLSYVALAKEAVLSGQSIKVLLAEKRKIAPDDLTNEEWDAIMSINERLRY